MFSCCSAPVSVKAPDSQTPLASTKKANTQDSEGMNDASQNENGNPPVPKLWKEARQIVDKTLERKKAWSTDEERDADLLAAMKAKPKAAQDSLQSFVDRSIMGIDIWVLRHTNPPVKGRFHLSQDLESWRLVLKGKERETPIVDIDVVSAWAPAIFNHDFPDDAGFATLELGDGTSVSLVLTNEDERNEFVMCLLIFMSCRGERAGRLFEMWQEDQRPDETQGAEDDEDVDVAQAGDLTEDIYAEKKREHALKRDMGESASSIGSSAASGKMR